VIRVGFVFNFKDNNWLGGISYYRNLIGAIYANPERIVEPVIITGYDSDNIFPQGMPAVQVIKDHSLDSKPPFAVLRIILKRLLRRDIFLEKHLSHLVKIHDISVLSHFGSLGRRSPIPTIGWIPDFQHRYLPGFFTRSEISGRDKIFRILCAECTRVIFSSNTAKNDAEKIYPEYKEKYRVLHFVTAAMDLSQLPDFSLLQEKYQLKSPYFVVPNQFWAHKNHTVILAALKRLKQKDDSIMVIATGNTTDYRHPDFFTGIQKTIREYGISENFIVAGIVPYAELLQLMIHSAAVINPSLFEGWSTTVEEAKALDLKIILSDIPVHREQNPDRSIFFNARDPEQLAIILLETVRNTHTGKKTEHLEHIPEKLHRQKILFAQDYEKIVSETLEAFVPGN